MPFIDISGPIVANTVYVDNVLVAKDVEATFPEVTPTMADITAMGTISLPVWQMIENLELAITKIGIDLGLKKMIVPDTSTLEFRFVQTVVDANGVATQKGCKAFFKKMSASIPALAITNGEASSNETIHTVTRYQLFVDGEEMFLIDKLAGILKINGVDYMKATNSLL